MLVFCLFLVDLVPMHEYFPSCIVHIIIINLVGYHVGQRITCCRVFLGSKLLLGVLTMPNCVCTVHRGIPPI